MPLCRRAALTLRPLTTTCYNNNSFRIILRDFEGISESVSTGLLCVPGFGAGFVFALEPSELQKEAKNPQKGHFYFLRQSLVCTKPSFKRDLRHLGTPQVLSPHGSRPNSKRRGEKDRITKLLLSQYVLGFWGSFKPRLYALKSSKNSHRIAKQVLRHYRFPSQRSCYDIPGKKKTMTMTKLSSQKTCYTYGHGPLKIYT